MWMAIGGACDFTGMTMHTIAFGSDKSSFVSIFTFTRLINKMSKIYGSLLNHLPLATKMVTSFTFMTSADAACQYLEKNQFHPAIYSQKVTVTSVKESKNVKVVNKTTREQKLDWGRTIRQGLVGMLVACPVNHFWFTKVMTANITYVPERLFPQFCSTNEVL